MVEVTEDGEDTRILTAFERLLARRRGQGQVPDWCANLAWTLLSASSVSFRILAGRTVGCNLLIHIAG